MTLHEWASKHNRIAAIGTLALSIIALAIKVGLTVLSQPGVRERWQMADDDLFAQRVILYVALPVGALSMAISVFRVYEAFAYTS